jgi:hypothetical protein
MAFSFANASGGSAAQAAGANVQTGPDLEDIQTEVHYQTWTNLSGSTADLYRLLGFYPSLEKPKFSYSPYHGLQISYLHRRPL